MIDLALVHPKVFDHFVRQTHLRGHGVFGRDLLQQLVFAEHAAHQPLPNQRPKLHTAVLERLPALLDERGHRITTAVCGESLLGSHVERRGQQHRGVVPRDIRQIRALVLRLVKAPVKTCPQDSSVPDFATHSPILHMR
ncbi:hypothetical protein [Stackebrandtia sp.]|uniref:hypothetical protein n=1 Tax=Stackebrandtia sp. TaxID=2023065 RepID=UPI0032C2395D